MGATRRYYKFLRKDGRGTHANRFTWPLPGENAAGEWVRVTGKLKPCVNGLHLLEARDLKQWITDGITDRLFVVEAKVAGSIRNVDKTVVQEARLLFEYTDWREAAVEQAFDAKKEVRDQAVRLRDKIEAELEELEELAKEAGIEFYAPELGFYDGHFGGVYDAMQRLTDDEVEYLWPLED